MFNSLKAFLCRQNYKKVLRRIRKSKENKPVKVVFLVTENSKWGYQSLYEEFEKDKLFEPLVVVAVLNSVHKGIDKTRMNLEENYNFFKSRGMNVEYGYKNHKYIDLKKFNPDIVFYEQPWGLPHIYRPYKVSKYALTCHSSYGYELFNSKGCYTKDFHKFLYTYFIDNILNTQRYESYHKGNSSNCVTVGYPKLDVYLEKSNITTDKYWKDSNKYKVIYAPHHSFEDKGLHMATFKQNGEFILNFAKNHPETTWIFKPHPRFKYALLYNNIMTPAEADNYYKEWAKVGNIYEQGDYFAIFKSSNLMITDCCSFLAEYLPSKNPLIRLLNNNSLSLNAIGEKIVSAYYCSNNNMELADILEKLIIEKNDYKKEERINVIGEVIDFKEKAAQKICSYLKKEVLYAE